MSMLLDSWTYDHKIGQPIRPKTIKDGPKTEESVHFKFCKAGPPFHWMTEGDQNPQRIGSHGDQNLDSENSFSYLVGPHKKQLIGKNQIQKLA